MLTLEKRNVIIKTVKEIKHKQTEVRTMKQNKKYFGNAVQAILDTAIEKYCVGGEENIEAIVRLLNTALDMAFMYDLKEKSMNLLRHAHRSMIGYDLTGIFIRFIERALFH